MAEGVGTTVQRSIGGEDFESLDPFLTLDEFRMSASASAKGSRTRGGESEGVGFPDHPHRGFETVTLMIQGLFQHEDFAGHKGTIGPGDVQWMTAGRGIVHAEMPLFLDEEDKEDEDKEDEERLEGGMKETGEGRGSRRGGGGNVPERPATRTKAKLRKKTQDIWGLQLWVNLPKVHKLCKPQYQELKNEKIPRWRSDSGHNQEQDDPLITKTDTLSLDTPATDRRVKGGKTTIEEEAAVEVKVIAGESHGVKSKVFTRTPTQYLEIKMKSRQSLTEWIPETFEGFVYVLQGRGYFGKDTAAVEGCAQQLLVLSSVQTFDISPSNTNTGISNNGNKKVRDEIQKGDSVPALLSDDAPLAPGQDSPSTTTAAATLPRSFLHIVTKDEPLHMVLITGEPCREPVFRQGPFVMASKDELERTFRDYEEKKRGFERAQGWTSTIGGQKQHKASSLSQPSLESASGGVKRKGRRPYS